MHELRSLPQYNLPAPLTPLVGREREIAAVCTLLCRPEVRLVTLTGTGGIGKTRLAVHVARELLADFPDGVFFVSLAPLSDPTLVLSTIAQGLDVKESGARPLPDLLIADLREKHLLLCLDNFEHLLPAAPQLTDLLRVCLHLTMLVTSRAVLHVQGEHLFPVPPLSVPDLTQLPPTAETLLSYAAVALFLQRAQALQPTFQITSTNARPIASVCIRLEGLPLAIELAAARIPLFPPQALLARLSQRLHFLTSGTRDVPARQQTLRNTIAWSYHLLDEEEQRLFRRLAIFVGSCTLQAVEAVCEAPGDGAGKEIDGVVSLIEKSLLQQTEPEGEEPRLRMLETMREYALEELFASGEFETTQQAYAAYYLSLAEQAESELEGPRQVRWLERLEREYDNLRAALTWGLSLRPGEEGEHQKELALRLGGALGEFWIPQSHLSEGRTFLEQALAASPRAASALRAKALSVTALLALVQFDKRAEVLAEEGLVLCQQQGDQAGTAYCLYVLRVCAITSGEYGQAYARLEQSAALFRARGNMYRLGWSLALQGVTDQVQGEYVGARAHYE
ncbi:MAG TPA: AAA family ATPase, partial [Ktedonobacteraceae bacterium]